MTDLSPQARALIARSRPALRPTEADRARVEAALQASLSAPPPVAAAGAKHALTWKVVTGVAVAVCVLGTTVALRLPVPNAPPTTQPTAAAAAPTPPAQAVPPPALEAVPPPALEVSPAPAPKPRAKATHDSLALEVELLSRATRALRAGDASAALKTLELHQQRFPQGALRQERRFAKAQALCTLERVQEGRAELAGLPKDTPASARAWKTCSPVAAD